MTALTHSSYVKTFQFSAGWLQPSQCDVCGFIMALSFWLSEFIIHCVSEKTHKL